MIADGGIKHDNSIRICNRFGLPIPSSYIETIDTLITADIVNKSVNKGPKKNVITDSQYLWIQL
jgi:hypothetical protein